MLRNISSCPYCDSVVAVDNSPEPVFNPDSIKGKCNHIVWMEIQKTTDKTTKKRHETDFEVVEHFYVPIDPYPIGFESERYFQRLRSHGIRQEILRDNSFAWCKKSIQMPLETVSISQEITATLLYAPDAETFVKNCVADWQEHRRF